MARRLGLVALLCLVAAGQCRASLPAAGAVEMSTGLRMQFAAEAGSSYCLLSDPCVHVNGLMGQAPGHALTWISGVGIRSGAHALSVHAEVPRGSVKAALLRAELDGADVTANLTRGEGLRTADSQMAVGVIEEGQLLLVTLSACDLRLLVRIRELSTSSAGSRSSKGQEGDAVPHFVVDTLDWQNLNAPHGIVGQTFPNRAQPYAFAKTPSHVATPVSPAAGLAAPQMSPGALERQRVQAQRQAALDGVPGDYLTTGLLEPNCAFSRFHQDGAAPVEDGVPVEAVGVAGSEGLQRQGGSSQGEEGAEKSSGQGEGAAGSEVFVGDDHDIEEAWELASHAASTVRSALASWWSRPNSAAGQGRQFKGLGRKTGWLSPSELMLIGETQGTREEAEERGEEQDTDSPSRQGPGGVVNSLSFSEEVDVRDGDEEEEDNSVRAGAWTLHRSSEGVRQDLKLLAEMQGTQETTEAPEPKAQSSRSAEAIQVLARMQGTAEADLAGQEAATLVEAA